MLKEKQTKILIGLFFLHLLNESDVVTFKQDSANVRACVLFRVHFTCVVQHQVHVFVEALREDECSALI